MIRKYVPLLAVVGLAACSGNPLNFGGTTPPEPPPVVDPEVPAPIDGITVPAGVAQHLRTATYNPGATTMRIDLRTLDGTPLEANYQRAPEFDALGYEAYTVQETRAQRQFLALFKRGDAVEAGVVADGGQFGKYFGGGTFRRLQAYTIPGPVTPLPSETNLNPQPTRLATYIGGYVGLLNSGPVVENSTLDPSRSFRVTGRAEINADFNPENLSVNGRVVERQVNIDPTATLENGNLPAALPLTNILFAVTEINAQGGFSGQIQRPGFEPAIGNYAGVFGGAGAAEIAGVTLFRPYFEDSALDDPRYREHGVFVAPKCIVGVVGAVNAPQCP